MRKMIRCENLQVGDKIVDQNMIHTHTVTEVNIMPYSDWDGHGNARTEVTFWVEGDDEPHDEYFGEQKLLVQRD